MARIGRNVDFNVSFDAFVNKYLDWLPTRPTVGSTPDPSVTKLSAGNNKPINLDIYGEAIDLTDLKTHIETKFPNVIFVINGNALNPEPTPEPPEPPLTYDPVIAKTALKNIITDEKNVLDALFQAEYTTLGGTGTVPNPEWKHYRWALSSG